MHILVEQHLKVPPPPHRLGAECYAADRRDAVVLRRTTHDNALTPGCQAPTHQRGQPEAGFVEKSAVCPATPGFSKNARKLIRLPAFYLLVIALTCPDLRLVTGPVQPPPKQSPHLVGVILDAEVALNELAHTGRRPQVVGKTVSGGSLMKKAFQFLHLKVCQAASATRGWFAGKAVGLPSHPSPAMQRCRPDSEDASANSRAFTQGKRIKTCPAYGL